MPGAAPDPSPDGRFGAATDSQLESDWIDEAVRRLGHRPRHPLSRARGLLLLCLVGVALVVLWLRLLAGEPHLPVKLRLAQDGSMVIAGSATPELAAARGLPVRALVLSDGGLLVADSSWLHRSPRWIVDDGERAWQIVNQLRIEQALRQGQATLLLADGSALTLATRARGLGGLGAICWAVSVLALVLYLAASVVVLTRPGLSAALYAAIALSQCVNLLLIGAESLPGLGSWPGAGERDLDLRLLADATTSAALVHLLLRYPRRLDVPTWAAPAVWLLVLGGGMLAMLADLPLLWWWAALVTSGCGLAGALALRVSQRSRHNPMAVMLQRLTLAGTGILLLLLLAIALADRAGLVAADVASVGSMGWVVFLASLLMLAPFLSSSLRVGREFAMLAGVGTVAASLDLLFVALFSLNQLASLSLALLSSVAIYAAGRHWIVRQLRGSGALSAERMFDSVYRVARVLEKSPEQAAAQLAGLLREIFDPLDVMSSSRSVTRVRVAADGSVMVVPVPQLGVDVAAPGSQGAIVMRHARRGQRLFTDEDRRLTERVIDQLRRAVAYDRAFERGRTEERTRLAQDLHDDIGARLLTLMYKAPNAEIESYIRHTLQDLKTLTRGLAASNHRLSHAAAEWKADISQRLNATGCSLQWSFSTDRDMTLNVVQWSGLTRVLRELVNNIISHAQATQVEISAQLDQGWLQLTVTDDGVGRQPGQWSHGLGLGGVRKRVRLLGGQVQWSEHQPRGIRCDMRVPLSVESA